MHGSDSGPASALANTRSWWLPLGLTAAVVLVVSIAGGPGRTGDETSYLRMAEGGQVLKPFANRFLVPLAVRGVHALTGLSNQAGFQLLSILSLAVWLGALHRTGRGTALADNRGFLLLLGTPVVLQAYHFRLIVDLPQYALIAVVLMFLYLGRPAPAAIALLLAVFTREASFLLAFCWLIVALRRRLWRQVALSAGVIAVGQVVLGWWTRSALPNIHDMPEWQYLLLKTPYNVLKNGLGVVLWTPSFDWTCPLIAQFDVFGRTIGLCEPVYHRGISTLVLYLTLFGVVPVCLATALRGQGLRTLLAKPVYVQVALLYGLLCWVGSPAMGDSLHRLMASAWPVFWVAYPALSADLVGPASRRLAFWQVILPWVGIVLWYANFLVTPFLSPSGSMFWSLLALAVAAVVWWRTARSS